jgi:hypothetical protein
MRPSVPWFLVPLALVTLLGCPLDIQVRGEEAEPDAGCQGSDCRASCTSDAECPDSERCYDFDGRCEPGPRLTEECSGFNSCQAYANCKNSRCELRCTFGCPLGYQCAPDGICVETCTGNAPETLGRFCASSLECTRCGVCLDSGAGKRCHQPCTSDDECPDGSPGSCQAVAGGSLHVCQLF